MNAGAAWVSFFYFGLIVVIYGTTCSIQTIKYSSEVKKYEKRTVDIEDGQEIIIGNYGACLYSEIKAHYMEGNETHEITLISSPPPYDGISCAVAADKLISKMVKLIKTGSHVAKISPIDKSVGYAFNFNTRGPIVFLVTFYLVIFPLVSVCLFLFYRNSSNQKRETHQDAVRLLEEEINKVTEQN